MWPRHCQAESALDRSLPLRKNILAMAVVVCAVVPRGVCKDKFNEISLRDYGASVTQDFHFVTEPRDMLRSPVKNIIVICPSPNIEMQRVIWKRETFVDLCTGQLVAGYNYAISLNVRARPLSELG